MSVSNRHLKGFISGYVFGDVEGLKFTKNNLFYVKENYTNFNVFDRSLHLSFITLHENKVEYYIRYPDRLDKFEVSYEDFWERHKSNKKIVFIKRGD